MRPHFEYYIDDNFKQSENTILYGKAIMIASVKGHKLSWTRKQKKIFFLKDTMTYKQLSKIVKVTAPTLHDIHKSAYLKLNKIIKMLLQDRDTFNKLF